MQVLTEIKSRGVEDVLVLACDGLKGLPDSVASVWPTTIVQTCAIHLVVASLRYPRTAGLGRDLSGRDRGRDHRGDCKKNGGAGRIQRRRLCQCLRLR